MYIFTRRIGVSKSGSWIAAFTFAFSGYVISTICLTTVLSSVTWFPLAMLFLYNIFNNRKYSQAIALGVVFSLMFIAGDPPVFIVTFLLFMITLFFYFIKKAISFKKFDLFIIGSFSITALTFFLLTAFQTIPAIEYYSQTLRSKMGTQEMFAWSVPLNHIFSFIIPYFNEPAFFTDDFMGGQKWLDNYYIGIITITLSGFGLWGGRRSCIVKSIGIMALVALLMSFGKYLFVTPLLYHLIPVLRLIRYPVRFIFIFTFGVCVLSGIGFDYIKSMFYKERFKRKALIILSFGFIFAMSAVAVTMLSERGMSLIMSRAGESLHLNTKFAYVYLYNLRRSFLYLASFCAFIFLFSRSKYAKFIVLPIFVLVLFDVLLTNVGYEVTDNINYYNANTPNIEYIQKDNSLFRILPSPYSEHKFSLIKDETFHAAVSSSKDRLVNNRMMEFGIYDAWGYDSSKLKRINELLLPAYRSKKPNDTNILNLLNIKYISSHDNMNAYSYSKVHKTDNATIYENKRSLPRAMLLRDVIIEPD